ncbi:MAG: hypothetical protein PHO91_00695 [Patescibacteria group bacterium]|nr:hypothetical protein [Patescibacteria group bacterium]
MSLNLPGIIWVYVERLYIVSYKADKFKMFLKSFDIEYDNDLYRQFTRNKPLYTFMSQEDYTFAQFMQRIPTYKYLRILENVIFDEEIIKTKSDNWNYYGEEIKNWYPNLIELLKLAKVEINYENKKLLYKEEADNIEMDDFFPETFNDTFIDYIRKEANESYKQQLYLSVMFLSRKILEVTTIRILEIVFPKLKGSNYDQDNHSLWYNSEKNQYHSFNVLIENLKKNSNTFQEDEDVIKELCSLMEPLRKECNRCVHVDYKIPDDKYINSWQIVYTIRLARKLFKKYCSP